MAKIYFIDTNNYSLKELNINSLPAYRRDKIERLAHDGDKLKSACAGLMVKKFFGDKEIKLNEYGKPYIENGKRFNLSHSGDYVVLALSEFEVGCDVEVTRDADYKRLGKIVFHENELKKLDETEDKKAYFFKLWTSKEAFIKCLGEGFHFNTSGLDLSELPDKLSLGGRTFFFKEYMQKGAVIMLCTEDKILPPEIKEIKL